MKAVKRNAVILTVMLFICAAVYLNWSYNKRVEDAATLEGGDISAMEKDGEGKDARGGDGAETEDGGDAADTLRDEGEAGLYYSVAGGASDAEEPASGQDGGGTAPAGRFDEYFAQVRLERGQARDEAASTLTAVAGAPGASAETVDGALQAMTRMAQYAVKEAELENLIRAKGFIDCVVYLTDDSVSVTVACDGGLDETGAAKITDVIVNNTEFGADKLRVTEIK